MSNSLLDDYFSPLACQSVRELLDRLRVRYADESELQAADLRSFFDLDTPEDVFIAKNISGNESWMRGGM